MQIKTLWEGKDMSDQNLRVERRSVADFVKIHLKSWRTIGPIVESRALLNSLATGSCVPWELEQSRNDPWDIEYDNEGAGAVLRWHDGQECRLTDG